MAVLAINTALGPRYKSLDFWEIIPSNTREWQETIEYLAIIIGMTLIGNVLGWIYRDARSRALIARSG